MTWKPSQMIEREAPTENFRSHLGPGHMPPTRAPRVGSGGAGDDLMVPTTAPWATSSAGAIDDPMAPTRAPWATSSAGAIDDPMAPTKAPWAK
jgi:hypothetical protein